MEKFSNWQYFALAVAVLTVVFVLVRYRSFKTRQSPGIRKEWLYEKLTELLLRYTDLAGQLAHEYRYAFNHADKLTPDSEQAAEEIITQLENTEKEIREKTNQLMLTDGTGLATAINNFLIPEKNIRHASPKDLEKYTETARLESARLIQKMREDLIQPNN